MLDPLFLEEVKRKYPSPISARDENAETGERESYCVGGALYNESLLHLDDSYKVWMFCGHPRPDLIAEALVYFNPDLTIDQSLDFAINMAKENDKENFEEAWAWAEKALYGV